MEITTVPSLLDIIILGMVEGMTEFLPVSSTGHLILTSFLLKLQNTEFLKSFEVAIQLGAILAILLIYAKRLMQGVAIYKRLALAFIPTATIGFVAYKVIKQYLFSPVTVSIGLIVGGIALILMDRWIEEQPSHYEPETLPVRNALLIGLIQCVSMIPGVSRAAATIIGGLSQGLNKRQATEFSFLLAIPTMLAATGYDLLKTAHAFSGDEINALIVGMIAAFVYALLAVKLFIGLLERLSFKYFGYYRIVIGVIFLFLSLMFPIAEI